MEKVRYGIIQFVRTQNFLKNLHFLSVLEILRGK